MSVMPSDSRREADPAGVPVLLVVMAVCTFLGALVIADFVAVAAWWMLPLALGAVGVGMAVTLGAIFYVLNQGDDRR
jgi:hypothetical protein